MDAPWAGHRNSDVTGPVGVSPERRDPKRAETRRGAESAEGLRQPSGRRAPLRIETPGDRQERHMALLAKSVGGADGKPSATQRWSRPRARRTPGEQRAEGRLTPAFPPRIPAGSKALKSGLSRTWMWHLVLRRPSGRPTTGGHRTPRGGQGSVGGESFEGGTP